MLDAKEVLVDRKAAAQTQGLSLLIGEIMDDHANEAVSVIAMLRGPECASVAQMCEMTGRRTNPIRGLLAGALRTRCGLIIISEKLDKVRIYRAASDKLSD